MSSPRVSVLLTCYNNRRYIERAVQSLRAQTFKDFEVLALDDGSTDGTREWLQEQSDLRVYLHPKNLGTYGNLNFGLKEAKGDLFAILNDDDYWGDEKIQRQVAAFDANPRLGLCHTSGWFVGPNGERIEGEPLGFPWPKTGDGNVLHELYYCNKVIASSAMFSRVAVEKGGPFDPSFYGCGDWHMWLRISEHFDVKHLDLPLVFYRIHDTNACLDLDKMNEDSLRIRTWLCSREAELAQRMRSDSTFARAFIHNVACTGTEWAWIGNRRKAIQYYLQSIRLAPWRLKSYLRILACLLPTDWHRKLR